MGERGNVVIVDDWGNPPLYLYTHWSGYQLGETVAKALARGQRWNDSSYLARIIFCEMVGKGSWADEVGYGIATAPPDNSYPYVVIDVLNRRVLIGGAGEAVEVRDRIQGDEPPGFIVVPFVDHGKLPAAFTKACEG